MAGRRPASRYPVRTLAIIVVAAAVASLFYHGWLRGSAVPAEFRYVPKEADLVLVAGDVDSLWQGIDRHFGSVIRAPGDPEGFVQQGASAAQEFFDDRMRELHDFRDADLIRSAADLEHHGIDIDRGLIVSAQLNGDDLPALEDGAPPLVIAVPVSDVSRFARFASALVDEEFAASDCGESPAGEVLQAGDGPALQLAEPEPGIALLAIAGSVRSSCNLLARALAPDNLAHARRDDFLFDVARNRQPVPLYAGPGIVLMLRNLPLALSPVMDLAAQLDLRGARLAATVRLEVDNDRTRFVDEVLAPPPAELPWRHALQADTSAVFVLRDSRLSRYVEFAMLNEGIADLADEWFGGILTRLGDLDDARQLVVAALGYETGLPKFALGIWAGESSLAALLDDAQRELRDRRDRIVLQGALDRYLAETPSAERPPGGPSVAELVSSDALAVHEPWFERFSIDADGELQVAAPDPAAFQRADYAIEIGDDTLRFLDPAVTENDFRYRLETEAGDMAMRSILLDGDYRIAAAIRGGVLWLTFGARDLERILERSAEAVLAGAMAPPFDMGAQSSTARHKGELFLNVPSLIETGLLSGERDLQESIEYYLLDLRHHPEIVVRLLNEEAGKSARLLFDARRADPGQAQ